jgi:type IV pilus assembly protein PilC
VASLLRERGCFAVEIKPARAVFKAEKFFRCGIDIKSMAFLCRQLSAMLDAGMPLLQCLHVLIAQTENKRLTRILAASHASVEKGNSLSSSFYAHRDCLPEIFINMIAAVRPAVRSGRQRRA